ncbi:MAG: transcription-repair coupling factor [Bacteroidetes bacterium]|nr:transcription-repair coupling factor [Bacteroidota bacterium]
MNSSKLLEPYLQHAGLRQLAQQLQDCQPCRYALKGATGSLQAVAAAALQQQLHRHLILMEQDREAAGFMLNDLEVLLPDVQVALFPAANKRPYELSSIDNANVLQRGETLNLISRLAPGELVVVTYPEALFERVINRTTLITHTLDVRVDESLGMDLLVEVLEDYGYEQAIFASQPGQFALRGGILDVFSFSHDMPYRLEFLGDTVESIREFDAGSQLSTRTVGAVSLIPDFRHHKVEEARISFLQYVHPETLWLVRSPEFAAQDLMRFTEKAHKHFEKLQQDTGGSTVQSAPEKLYYSGELLLEELRRFQVIDTEIGGSGQSSPDFSLQGSPQPLFKKKFELLAQHMMSRQQAGWQQYLFCDSESQHRRLREILQQLEPQLTYIPVRAALSGGFEDSELCVSCYTDHQIFERYHRFKSRTLAKQSGHLTLRELMQMQPGDYITHINHGIGRFGGLETLKVGNHTQEAVKIFFKDDDVIYVNVNALYKISRYTGKEGHSPKLNKLGTQEWSRTKAKVKSRVKELAFNLVALYAKRKAAKGFIFSSDSYLQNELEASFLYEDTPDQERATLEVKQDMESTTPMDRLVCGDVGFGKTEVAVRAAFKAVTDGKQVAVLVPTTILALQHCNTFADRMADFPVSVDFLTRMRTAGEQKMILEKLAQGKLDIIIGTHKLLGKEVKFKDLGLLVIDEEHKFGVAAKEKLRLLRETVDTLTLTATPIPRTLQFSLLGIRDLSVISTPPPNRQPVETVVTTFSKELLRDAIAYELRRGGQVFFIHNRIKDLQDQAALIKDLVPDARITTAHGQMEGDEMENMLLRFMNREYDVLVSTTIVESGLDIPNANTIIINQAHSYGLSDLHQMRGRVGRSNRKAYAYLLAPPLSVLPTDSRKRLQAIQEFSDLGSGIQIAMRDLDIRGAGDILGSEQSGFIADVGYDVYHKILDEAIQELKASQGLTEEGYLANTSENDCQVDTDLEVMLPPSYVPQVAERLFFYRQISEAMDEDTLVSLAKELQDRFGLLPPAALALMDTVRVRKLGQRLRFQKVTLKAGNLSLSFDPGPEDPYYQSATFQGILGYVQQQGTRTQLKQKGDRLVLQLKNVGSVKEMLFVVQEIEAAGRSTQAVLHP